VIIAGESHGGGLVMALLLLLRDCNLPFPAGAIGLSPWVDLTHSLPSIISNIATDYLPSGGFSHKHSRALEFDSLPQFEAATLGPLGKAVRKDSSLSHEDLDRVQFYAPNQTLKMRYVSPIFDEQGLGGLPPLLIVCVSPQKRKCIFSTSPNTDFPTILLFVRSKSERPKD
jgi:acetyl esterase/lipase